MVKGRRNRRHILTALVGGCAVAMLSTLPAFDRLADLDVDLLHGLSASAWPSSPPDTSRQHVAVIAIDEATHATEPFAGLPKVMWTPHIARVQDAVLGAKPASIGWDLILPTSAAAYVADRGFDKPLLSSLAQAAREDRIVLGTAQLGDNLIRPHRLFSFSAGGGRNLRSLNINVDRDGVVRRVPLHLRVDTAAGEAAAYVPSMALELAARKAGSPAHRTAGGGLAFGTSPVAAAVSDAILINFQGDSGTVPTYSLADLHQCAEAGNDAFFAEHFAGKAVLLGLVLDIEDRKLAANRLVTDGGAQGPLIHCTGDPPGRVSPSRASTIPGVYLHAAAINNLLNGDGLIRPAQPWQSLAVMPFPAFTAVATMTVGPLMAVAATFGAALLLMIAAIAAFSQSLVLPVTAPLTLGLLTFTTVVGFRFIYLDREQRFLRKAFSSYVSPELVETLVANPDQLKLGGERRNMSFLFTDIAGFTSLAEELDPVEVGSLLNRYLDKLLTVAKMHGGTIDKIIGDAVVVIFSAPVVLNNHNERAVACALAMSEAAENFADARRAEGMNFGITRIGVHSGTAIVGNFGGDDFFDYTAIGDAMNTAARLESANKQLGTTIAVSGETAKLCDNFSGRPIGQVVFKGKSKPVEVFEPLATTELSTDRISGYLAAYSMLDKGEPEARESFERLAEAYPDDGLIAMHCTRIRAGKIGTVIMLDEK